MLPCSSPALAAAGLAPPLLGGGFACSGFAEASSLIPDDYVVVFCILFHVAMKTATPVAALSPFFLADELQYQSNTRRILGSAGLARPFSSLCDELFPFRGEAACAAMRWQRGEKILFLHQVSTHPRACPCVRALIALAILCEQQPSCLVVNRRALMILKSPLFKQVVKLMVCDPSCFRITSATSMHYSFLCQHHYFCNLFYF